MSLTEKVEHNLAETRQAYANRMNLVLAVAHAERDLVEAQKVLETAKYSILASTDPKELGSNEAIRTAKIAELTAVQSLELVRRQERLRKLQTDLEMARLECRCCDLTLQHLALLQQPATAA